MTTKDEALKLALEALLSCSVGDYSTGHVIHPSFDADAVNKAIEAIDALAEQTYPDNFIHALMYDVAKRDSEALAERCVCGEPDTPGTHRTDGPCLAEQPAPVAEPHKQQEHVSVMTVLHLKDRTEIGYGPASAGYDLPTGEYKLYTSPPANANAGKPWVGLTDEEMHDCWDSPLTPLGMKHVRMIEAKLREKNAS